MISTANDDFVSAGGWPVDMEMTVFELAAFLCLYRAGEPMRPEEIRTVLSGWFERTVTLQAVSRPLGNMIARGWLIGSPDRMRPSNAGREVARPLLGGIIRMLDQGTRLIDVALMLSVLRLTKGELDGGLDQ